MSDLITHTATGVLEPNTFVVLGWVLGVLILKPIYPSGGNGKQLKTK